MDYTLAIENAPDTIAAGTGLLLLHPSIGETDRIDTDFLKTDTDHFLVVSTRTTAREVEQAEHDAVGIFHLSKEVHDQETLDDFTELFDGIVDLGDDGSVTVDF